MTLNNIFIQFLKAKYFSTQSIKNIELNVFYDRGAYYLSFSGIKVKKFTTVNVLSISFGALYYKEAARRIYLIISIQIKWIIVKRNRNYMSEKYQKLNFYAVIAILKTRYFSLIKMTEASFLKYSDRGAFDVRLSGMIFETLYWKESLRRISIQIKLIIVKRKRNYMTENYEKLIFYAEIAIVKTRYFSLIKMTEASFLKYSDRGAFHVRLSRIIFRTLYWKEPGQTIYGAILLKRPFIIVERERKNIEDKYEKLMLIGVKPNLKTKYCLLTKMENILFNTQNYQRAYFVMLFWGIFGTWCSKKSYQALHETVVMKINFYFVEVDRNIMTESNQRHMFNALTQQFTLTYFWNICITDVSFSTYYNRYSYNIFFSGSI